MESALNQQLFCRKFKKRQPYEKVGNFSLRLASLDKSEVLSTMEDALQNIMRYKSNLFIYKSKSYKFSDSKYLFDSQFFWKQILNEMIDLSKDERTDCSFSLQRGIYPNLETLFVNLRVPYLSDSNFDYICPMLFDLDKREEFGFYNPYILEFHDIESFIKYLRRLWKFKPNEPKHGNNFIEINCICVK